MPAAASAQPAPAQNPAQAQPVVPRPGPTPPRGPGPDPYGYITATGDSGERRIYVHIAALVEEGRTKPNKVAVKCVHGVVTNLCDFRLHSAVWDDGIKFSDARLCKVCMSRARRAAP